MKTICSLFILIVVLCFISCKNGGEQQTADSITDVKSTASDQALSPENQVTEPATDTTIYNAGSPATTTEWDRKIIKNAALTLELADLKSFTASLYTKIKMHGGYVASEEQHETEDRQSGEMVIKVPVNQFEHFLSALTAGQLKVISKNITSNDVSMEVVDTRSRIEAKKLVRERYLELIGKAKNVKEILSVENELNVVQEGVESASGKLAFLNHQSALSTITLSTYQLLPVTPAPQMQNNFFAELVLSFKTGLDMLTGLLLGLLTLWPIVVAGIAIWLYARRFKSKKISI